MNNKGDLTGIIYLIVMVCAFGIFLLILGYVAPQISTKLVENIGITSEINNSLGKTSSVAKTAAPTLWFIVFAGLLIGLMITAWQIPSSPVFAIPFAILLIIAVVIAMPLSNAYESLYTSGMLGTAPAEQGAIWFVMSKLPLFTLIIGAIILIISFAKPGGSYAVPV